MENFSEVFNIVQGDVISFTGGGGKTSLIFYLAEELSQKGRVLITTTTKMYIPNEESYDNLILQDNLNVIINLEESLDKRLEKRLEKKVGNENFKNIDFLGNFLDLENGKLIGVEDKVLKEFLGEYHYILIEADGSAGKNIKYWNDSDPVISKYTDKIIGITNLEALEKTVEEGVHRYENFCKRYGIQKEQKIDCGLMIKYINSGEFFKTSNEVFSKQNIEIKKIEKYIFLNGIEGVEKFNSALKISKEINLENIVLGSIREREIYPYRKISAIALLSGFSKRMGEDKLFLNFINRPLESYLMENLVKINFHKKILVSTDERIDKLSRTEYELLSHMEHEFFIGKNKTPKEEMEVWESGIEKFTKIINSTPEKGQGYSIKLGVESDKKKNHGGIRDTESHGYMFFMGDQPLLKFETILKLMKEFMKNGEITLPIVNGEEFSPVIFPNGYRDKLCEIKGDRGGKSIIQLNDIIKRVIFQDVTEFMDIDTPEEMKKLENIEKMNKL